MMESQIWHHLTGSVGRGFRKGTMPSAHLDSRHFSFSLYTIGAFQAATPLLELRGNESEWVSPCVGSLRGTAWGSKQKFLPLTQRLLAFAARSCGGLIFLTLESWAGGPGMRLGLLAPKISLPNFYPPHVGEGPARSYLCPSYQSGWMWFL